jgi:Anti-sigma-K factor rskA
MNTVEYIASGILEQYVSGTATLQERKEVECMSHIYPEIQEALLAIDATLEAYAMATAVAPPVHVRKNIFDAIAKLETEDSVIGNTKNNIETNSLLPNNSNTEISENKIEATIKPLSFVKRNHFKSAAAVLFLMSAGLGYMLYNANRNANNFANDLAIIKLEIANQKNIIETKNTYLAVLQNKQFLAVTMAGIPTKSPESNAVIYWNKQSEEVFVAVKKLPTPAKGKQYQLWAIADGKPVDLGMISNDITLQTAFQKMKTIKNPQAFAVTLEVAGGVQSPTMSEMYVMGGV